MRVRKFERADAPAISEIFYRSVREVARAKYSEAQVEAWAPAPLDAARWAERLHEYDAFVAEDDTGKCVGWIAMTAHGYLDMLFCLPEATRSGVAPALYAALERAAFARGLPRIWAHASLLALTFFEKQGWTVDEYESVERGGVSIPRAVMSKRLPLAQCRRSG